MTDRQYAMLTYIHVHPGCTRAAVANHDYAGPGHAASYTRLKRMERRGWIVDKYDGPYSRSALHLTPAGRAAIRAHRDRRTT